MQTAREHPRQSGAIGPSDPPAESFIPQTGGPGNASFSFVSLATAASFGFGLKTILLDRDRGNDAGVSRSVPRADRTRVANHQEDAPKTAATQKEDISALPPLVIGCSSDPQALADPRAAPTPPGTRPAVHRPERLRAHPESSQRVRRMRAHGYGQAGQQEIPRRHRHAARCAPTRRRMVRVQDELVRAPDFGGVCIRPLQRRSLSPKPTQKLEGPAAELLQIGLLETSGASEERSLGLREPALGAPSLN